MSRKLRTLVLDLTAVALGFAVASVSTTVLAAAHLVSSTSMVPSVFLLSPSSGQALNGTVTVSASASSDTDVLQFQLNGANLGPAITVGACSVSWNTSTVADGTYNLTVMGIDSLGNSSSSSPATITVENSAPLISNVAPAGVTSASATITWTTNQPASSGVDYGQTPYTNSSPLDVTMTTQHAETIVGLAPSTTYHFRVSSWNGVGILGTSGDFVFTTSAATVSTSGNPQETPTPTPTPTVPGGCTTPDPFANMGGGTCTDGGWYPPATAPAPTPTPTPTPTPASTPTPTPTPVISGGCSTPDPFVAIGGGTCLNGGWSPRNVPPTQPVQTPQPPQGVFTPPSAPGQASKCTTADPFVALGGGTCFKGGWFPPGMLPAPGNVSPVTPPVTPSGGTGGCVTPDPFSSIHGLHGVCVGGGWYPVKNNQ